MLQKTFILKTSSIIYFFKTVVFYKSYAYLCYSSTSYNLYTILLIDYLIPTETGKFQLKHYSFNHIIDHREIRIDVCIYDWMTHTC